MEFVGEKWRGIKQVVPPKREKTKSETTRRRGTILTLFLIDIP
jgi:hypothetical protein